MIKILLVEDNDVDARLTQDILTEWGVKEFDIIHVTRLSDAVTHLARTRFDAVLLDLSLPDGFGLSTVRQMQAANPTVAIIVLSGLNDQTLALQVVQNGAQDYLVKGQGQSELLARSIRAKPQRSTPIRTFYAHSRTLPAAAFSSPAKTAAACPTFAASIAARTRTAATGSASSATARTSCAPRAPRRSALAGSGPSSASRC